MAQPVRFVLNTGIVEFDGPTGRALVDVIRQDAGLKGTKHACREGDCGSCVVLVGEVDGDAVHYRPMTSCLMPVAAAAGRHVITVEGLDFGRIGPLQQPFVDEGASQCGFCTPGFLLSFAGHLLTCPDWSVEPAYVSLAGNICRCTGYASIQRAVNRIMDTIEDRIDPAEPRFAALVREGFLPAGLRSARSLVFDLDDEVDDDGDDRPVAGGTDLYVQRPDDFTRVDVTVVRSPRGGTRIEGDEIVIAGSATAEHLKRCPILNAELGDMVRPMDLMGSLPIRERATVAGNIVNASPIGDMTMMLLALDAELDLVGDAGRRSLPLRRFYLGYKTMDLKPGELVESIRIRRRFGRVFNFEKVSKRTHLDIASVNSAAAFEIADGAIVAAGLSAGGVAPVPLALMKTEALLIGRNPDAATAWDAARCAVSEVSPIDDIRGSAAYKRLLLRQLVLAHFHELFDLDEELAEGTA
ncbi:MAG: FAD binding domain-containing protein [Thermoanaerobaculales bacterium]|nr:FAD binding domain-containing protein [Thermoanaerobaculales bacterium]